MATSGDSIQIDNGEFIRIHNAIFELLAKAPLRGQQFRCLMFLFRKTYGFNKKEDKISLAQWAEGTGMEKHNVWRELQLLIKCNVIYMASSGPKRPNTWGFNKHHEEWNFDSVVTGDYKSVVTVDDSFDDSVVGGDYSDENSVVTSDYKSVVTPHEHTKDNKDSSSLLAAESSKRNVSDFVKAYEGFWGLTVSSPYVGDEIKDWEGRVTFEGWRYALKECADTRHIGNWKYLRRILERLERDGYQPQTNSITPATVDFAIEDLSQ